MREHIDYYNENGKFVLTSFFLWNRGFCCRNGCRHCPYRDGLTKDDVMEELETRICQTHKSDEAKRLIALAVSRVS